MAKHTVVNTELMRSEYDASVIRSVRIGDTDLDNGVIVKIGALEQGEREVHAMTVATANTDKVDGKVLAILVTPETGKSTYDERHCELDDFYNVAGGIGRALILQHTDQFAVTKEAFTADAAPEANKFVEIAAGGKYKVVAAATNAFGKIQDVANGFYGIEVL